MAATTKRVRLSSKTDDNELSIFERRDLFLSLLSYLKMKEICCILVINKQLNEWINHYATNINKYFGLPLYHNEHESLWKSINNLLSKSILKSKPYIIPNIKHKECLYFISYKSPFLLLVSWDHSFSIIQIEENIENNNNNNEKKNKIPNKPISIKLNNLSKFGENNHRNYFGKNKERKFRFSNWEQFYSIDFQFFIHENNEKLLIAFGGNINLYLAVFDIKTNQYDIISHGYEEEEEFNHNENNQSRDQNQHWIRTISIAPSSICDIHKNGYFLIISGHGYGGEIFGSLAVNKKCEIVHQKITSEKGYNGSGCDIQTRSITFYYDKENNIKLLILAIVYEDKCNSLLIYNINCLKYKVEIDLIHEMNDKYGDDLFGGAVAMRNNYLITTGEGGTIYLWKINKQYTNKLTSINNMELFKCITKYQDIYDDIWFINEIHFFHDNFFTLCSSSGMIQIIHIDDEQLNIIKTWYSKNEGFWGVACVNNYIFCGNEDGNLCSYVFQ